MTDYIPAKNAYSRVFLIERRARMDRAPVYHSSLIAGSVEQSFGDPESIKVPDPDRYGEFTEIGTIAGEEERPTTSLTGRYAADLASTLLRLAKIKCESDIQVHFGTCQSPNNFNEFDKAIVFESAKISSHSTEELGAIEPGDSAPVNETAEVSGKVWYEVLPLAFAERAGSVVTNEVLDVVVVDTIGCGECEDESDGCQKIYAVTAAAGGSPGTPADLLYSPDNGVTWYATDVDGASTETPAGVALVGDYIVIPTDGDTQYYLDKDDLAQLVAGTGDPTFTAVATGYVAAGTPADIWSVGSLAFIVGDGGYVYSCSDGTAGVTALDAGVATTENLKCVHALSTKVAVAGGENGVVIYTLDGSAWTACSTVVTGSPTINAVWAVTNRFFIAVTATGYVYYTKDRGLTWTEKSFVGSGSGVGHDIAFASDSVGYLSHATTAPRGRILRTYDGGYSWNVLPEGTGSLPLSDRFTALAVCKYDPNFVVGVGLADDGTDGIVIRGVD